MWRAGLLSLALAACTQFPELEDTIGPEAEAADYPGFIPLGPVLAEAAAAPSRQDETEDTVAERAESLKARAEALRGGVVDDETQARMQRGVDLE